MCGPYTRRCRSQDGSAELEHRLPGGQDRRAEAWLSSRVAMHEDQIHIDWTSRDGSSLATFHGSLGPLRPVDSSGTVNANYRVGETTAARFPCRAPIRSRSTPG